MILIIYFDKIPKYLVKQCIQHNLDHKLLHFESITHAIFTSNIHTVIICGSDRRVLRDGRIPIIDWLYNETTIPIVGICYGFQYMSMISGGTLKEGPKFKGKRSDGHNYYNHHDKVIELPHEWTVISTVDGFISMAANKNRIGFQFHPEMSNSDFKHYLLPILAKQ